MYSYLGGLLSLSHDMCEFSSPNLNVRVPKKTDGVSKVSPRCIWCLVQIWWYVRIHRFAVLVHIRTYQISQCACCLHVEPFFLQNPNTPLQLQYTAVSVLIPHPHNEIGVVVSRTSINRIKIVVRTKCISIGQNIRSITRRQ